MWVDSTAGIISGMSDNPLSFLDDDPRQRKPGQPPPLPAAFAPPKRNTAKRSVWSSPLMYVGIASFFGGALFLVIHLLSQDGPAERDQPKTAPVVAGVVHHKPTREEAQAHLNQLILEDYRENPQFGTFSAGHGVEQLDREHARQAEFITSTYGRAWRKLSDEEREALSQNVAPAGGQPPLIQQMRFRLRK